MKVLMRVKNYNSDKILLKPLTFEEYQEKVACYCKDVETNLETLKNLYEAKHQEWMLERMEEYTNFFIMPIPANNFQAKSVWINAQNLQKYRI
jgi:hypothetical protein